jgi:hypothetical protein
MLLPALLLLLLLLLLLPPPAPPLMLPSPIFQIEQLPLSVQRRTIESHHKTIPSVVTIPEAKTS